MYEKNQPFAMRRSGDEFLRRMQSGELPVSAMPVMEQKPSARAPMHNGGSCRQEAPCPPAEQPNACPYPPVNPNMPSLAMVYSPEQSWRCLYAPEKALSAGTLFAELDKPFEGRSIYRRAR